MPEPSLSVAMIVKNEEAMLPRCLASIAGFWDQLIVVDTGSSDRTVEIAESFGATVHHHPWEGDFSKARTQSLSYVTGDWVFIIDADETLDAEGVERLRRAIRETAADLIAIREISVSSGGRQESGHTTIRLWRHGRGVHYEGAVHNDLVYDGTVEYVPARLYHYGYDLDREAMWAKFLRTTGILKAEREKDPDNPKWPYYLAVSYHTEEMIADALDMAQRSLAACGDSTALRLRWLPNYYIAAACHLALGDLDAAQADCETALGLMDRYLDAWAVLTSVHFIRRDSERLAQAAARYRELRAEYLEHPQRFDFVPMHTLTHEPDVRLRLALDAANRGDDACYEQEYRAALACARHPEQVVQNTARYLARIGLDDRATEVLDEALRDTPACAPLVEQKLRLLLDRGALDAARTALTEARNAGYPDEAARFQSGVIDLVSGKFAEARETLEALLAQKPDHTEARINLGLALEGLGLLDAAEAAYLASIDQDPNQLDAAVNLGNLYARNGKKPEAIAFLEKVAALDPQQHDVQLKLIGLYWDTDDVDRLFQQTLQLAHGLGLSVNPARIEGAADLGLTLLAVGRRLRVMRRGLAAVMAFEMAQRLLPDREDAFLACGEALGSLGRYQAAVTSFEQAVRINPRSVDAFKGMAAAYEALGAREAASLCTQKIRELNDTPTLH